MRRPRPNPNDFQEALSLSYSATLEKEYKTMGQTVQRVSQEDVRELSESTGFSSDEIEKWSESFLREYPRGVITREEFQALYHRVFPFGDSKNYADLVFGALQMPNNTIDIKSFLRILSIAARGSIDQKIEWVFSVYDRKGDGYLDREELLPAIEAAYKVPQCMDDFTEGEEDPKSRLEKIFNMMDPENTGKITLERLKEGCLRDSSILEGLNLYGNLG